MLRGLLTWMLLLLVAPVASAVDFRIETKVFSGNEDLPISHNTTLVQSGVVYDFLESPKRVAIFRRPSGDQPGTFLLIDPMRSVKTEVTTDRIDNFVEKLRTWSRTQREPLLVFAADPEFTESFDMESGALSLVSEQMTYRLSTVAVERMEVWPALRDYFDEYAKLNCLLSSSTMSPFPRLQVNNSLEKHNVVPEEVILTLAGKDSTRLRAEHVFTWRLSKDDRARISLVGEQLVSFRNVSNAEFHKDSVAAK